MISGRHIFHLIGKYFSAIIYTYAIALADSWKKKYKATKLSNVETWYRYYRIVFRIDVRFGLAPVDSPA